MSASFNEIWKKSVSETMVSILERTKVEQGLHIVATPIGNLADISLRALVTLRSADIILCEDTRVTAKLKKVFSIETSTEAYHDYNSRKVLPNIITNLENGKIVALVSDAGTPTISDPGYRLIKAAQECNIPIIAVPGASAVLTALASSGLPTNQFFFAGFLPAKPIARRKALSAIRYVPSTLVFYETANRLASSLADMVDIYESRQAVISRELTKRFEEIRRGELGVLAKEIADGPRIRGEIVVMVGPSRSPIKHSLEEIDIMLKKELKNMSVRDATAAVALKTGIKRKTIYARALTLKGKVDVSALKTN